MNTDMIAAVQKLRAGAFKHRATDIYRVEAQQHVVEEIEHPFVTSSAEKRTEPVVRDAKSKRCIPDDIAKKVSESTVLHHRPLSFR